MIGDWFPATAAQFLVVVASAVPKGQGGTPPPVFCRRVRNSMKRKDLSFFRVQKSAKNCKRVRKDMKRKGIGDRESDDRVSEGSDPLHPHQLRMIIKGKNLRNLQFTNASF